MKSKNPFGNPRKHDPQELPKPPIAQAADKPDWVALITNKDAKKVKKAMDHDLVMKNLHDKLMGATGLHSKPNKK